MTTPQQPPQDGAAPQDPVTEPVPTEPVPSEPEPEPEPGPVPAQPVPADPLPTDPVPADPEPTDPVPADPEPTEPVAAEPEPIPPTPPTAETPRRARPAWLPVAAVAAAVALLAAGTGALAYDLRQRSQAETARDEALDAARDAARLLFSYDHTTLEEDFAKGLAVTTGGFREQYSTTTVDVVTPVAEQYDAVVEAQVLEAAVVEADAHEVTTLVFLNQATTSTRVTGQQVDQSRVSMRLVERDGRWLVDRVTAL